MAPRPEPTVRVEVDCATTAQAQDLALPAALLAAPDSQPHATWLQDQLGSERLAVSIAGAAVDAVAAANGAGARVLVTLPAGRGDDSPGAEALVRVTGLSAGMKRLSVYRLDGARRWRDGAMVPMEVRETTPREGTHEQQLFLPTDCLALICLDPVHVRADLES